MPRQQNKSSEPLPREQSEPGEQSEQGEPLPREQSEQGEPLSSISSIMPLEETGNTCMSAIGLRHTFRY